MKIYRNPYKSMQIHRDPWNTMRVLRRQEASLESSKGFSKGSRSNFKALDIHTPKSMKIYEIPWKSKEILQTNANLRNTMKILRGQEASLGGQEASLESSKCFYKSNTPNLKALDIHTPISMKIYESPWKSMEIWQNLCNSMNINEHLWITMKVLRGQETSLESSKGFYKGGKSNLKALDIHTPKSLKIYENL